MKRSACLLVLALAALLLTAAPSNAAEVPKPVRHQLVRAGDALWDHYGDDTFIGWRTSCPSIGGRWRCRMAVWVGAPSRECVVHAVVRRSTFRLDDVDLEACDAAAGA